MESGKIRFNCRMFILAITLLLFCFPVSYVSAMTKEELWQTAQVEDSIVNLKGEMWITQPVAVTDKLLDRFIAMAPDHLLGTVFQTHPDRRMNRCEVSQWLIDYRYSGGVNVFELEVLKEVNKVRGENGLNALKLCPYLSMSSRLTAQLIAETGVYSHRDRYYGTPQDRMNFFNSNITGVVENIWVVETISFNGQIVRVKNNSAQLIVEGWMNSPSHRNAMLKDTMVYVGVGHINDSPLAPVVLNMSPERGDLDASPAICTSSCS